MNLDIAVALCQRFEGFRARPYLCPAGVPTIGYGSTYYPGGVRVALTDPEISEPHARSLLIDELTHTYLPGVLRACPGLASDSVRLNAIVDFAYNLGVGRLQTSTLRKRVNAQDWPGASQELGRWVRAGGRVLPGLVKRRAAEALILGG